MRQSTRAVAIGAIAWIAALAPACSRAASPDTSLHIECTLHPNPPIVGPATIDLVVTDPAEAPVEHAKVHVEGNMNHAGMVPSTADAEEDMPGRYRASLDFTMAGDWFLLVAVELQDGRKIETTIPVPAVRGR